MMEERIDWDAPILEIIAALEREMDRRMTREENRLVDIEVAAVLAVDRALKERGMRVSDEEFSQYVNKLLAEVR